jgi:hypothetical protein
MFTSNKKPFLRKKRFFNITMPPKLIAKLKNSQLFNSIFPDRTAIVIFLLAFTLLLTFWQVGLLLNDEWITANQLTNLKNGSLTVEVIKYGGDWGIYNMSGRSVGAYTHALPVFALPVYYVLAAVDHIINLRLFFILVWLLAVCALIYYYSGTRRTKYVLAILALLFCATNLLLYFFPALYGFWSFLHHPLEFARWGEIVAINIVNITAMCIVILVIYRLFKHIFDSERIGFVAALIGLIGTSFSLWALTGKDHSVSLLFIMLAIYFYYSYAQSNPHKNSYKYIAFAMVGLELWVRAEAAVPLFCALILTELLFVYRNNTAQAQLLNITRIVLVILISLMPFFINNYLLFGNIFLPTLTDVVITGTTTETAPITAHGMDQIVAMLRSTSKIPALFGVMFGQYHVLPGTVVPFLFHSDKPWLMSIFEVCPLLIFSVLMLYRLFLLLRRSARAILKTENYLPFLFLCYIITHILIYSGYTVPFYGGGTWDYRYFLPIYVPLLYFAFSFLHQYNVLDKVEEITTALTSCIVILTPALIFGVCVFGNRYFYHLCFLCEIIAWIAITILLDSFIYLLIKRTESSKKMFAYAIGFSIFTTFFWLFGIGFMWGKTLCAGFVLPAMNILHGVIAYHAGLRFFMDTVPHIIQLSTQL